MKFLNVIHYPIFGGPHNRAIRLSKALSRRGYNTLVLISDERGNAEERFISSGVSYIKTSLHRCRATFDVKVHISFFIKFWKEVLSIKDIIYKREIDFVLISGLVNIHSAIAASLANVPVIWQITDSRTPALLRLILMPIVKKFGNSVMFNGSTLVKLYVNRFSFNLPFFVYYPPVDTSRFYFYHHMRETKRRQLGLPKNAVVVGTVANINPQKGIEYFIRAASAIHGAQPNCYFVIIGARYETHCLYNKFIEDELALTGVPQERFVFLGSKSDIEKYYPLMDVKLITSVPRSEGTTTTAMEAMACGLPVVATDVGAVREVVEDGITGFVVPPLEPEKIAQATLRLLKNPDLRKHMGETARQRAVKYYDIEVCADTHVRAFEAALEHHLSKKVRTSPNTR